MVIGRIHSKESFGTVDGPGIRYVLFMQGCPMRCLYCHNPDTWTIGTGTEITADEVIEEFQKNRGFYSKGGITVSGGEPLLQVDFLLELFKKCKEKEIHTCIDTSGITFRPENEVYVKKLDELMQYTDLVMLDIKHIDPEWHKKLTSKDNKNILDFLDYLEAKHENVWIRHVVVPGYTDDPVYLRKLGEHIGKYRCVKALDVLPYHTMGVSKYEALGIEYPLAGVPALDFKDAIGFKKYIIDGVRTARANLKNSK